MYILKNFHIKIINSPEGQKGNCGYSDWKKDDGFIKSWIPGTLSEEVLFLVTGLNMTKMWQSLQAAFTQDTRIMKDHKSLVYTIVRKVC